MMMAFTSFFGGEFFSGDFFGSGSVIDTHDGFDTETHKKKKDERARLRDAIRFAISGPEDHGLEQRLEAIATPQVSDSVYVPIADRVNYDRLAADVELYRSVMQKARREEIDREDEEFLLLT